MTRKEILTKLAKALGGKVPLDDRVEPLDKDSDEERVVMCMRTVHGPPALATAIAKPCASCGEEVWVSPSTTEMVEQYNATVKCIECVMADDAQRDDFCVSTITPTQQMELNNYYKEQDDAVRNAFLNAMRSPPRGRDD